LNWWKGIDWSRIKWNFNELDCLDGHLHCNRMNWVMMEWIPIYSIQTLYFSSPNYGYSMFSIAINYQIAFLFFFKPIPHINAAASVFLLLQLSAPSSVTRFEGRDRYLIKSSSQTPMLLTAILMRITTF